MLERYKKIQGFILLYAIGEVQVLILRIKESDT